MNIIECRPKAIITGADYAVFLVETMSGLILINRIAAKIKINADGIATFKQESLDTREFDSGERFCNFIFIQRDVLSFFDTLPYYKKIKEVFDNDSLLQSIIVGFYKNPYTMEETLYLYKSRHLFPAFKNIVVDTSDKNASKKNLVPVESFNMGVENTLDDAKKSIDAVEEESITDSLDLMFMKKYESEMLTSYIKSEFEARNSYFLAIFVNHCYSLSSFSNKYLHNFTLMQKVEKEIINTIFFDRPTTPALFGENEEHVTLARNILDGIDSTTSLGKNFYNAINVLKRIYTTSGLPSEIEQMSKKVDDMFDDSYVDISVLPESIVDFFELFKNLHKQTDYKMVNAEHMLNIFRLFEQEGKTLPPPNLNNPTLFVRDDETDIDDVNYCVGMLPIESVFKIKVSKDSLLDAININKHFPMLKKFEIIQKDNSYFIYGIKSFVGTSIPLGEKKIKDATDSVVFNSNIFSMVRTKILKQKESPIKFFTTNGKNIIERFEKINKSLSVCSEAGSKIISEFSSISNLGPEDRKFSNPSILNPEFSVRVSISDIANSQSMIDSLHFKPSLNAIIRSVAKKCGIEIPRHRNLIIKPSIGTADIPSYLKEEHISGHENMGLLKNKYAPILDIREDAEKKKIYEVLTTSCGELPDSEDLKKIIEESSYIMSLTKKAFLEDLVVSLAPIAFISTDGKVVKELNMDIYEYVSILQKNDILNLKDIVDVPFATLKIKNKIVQSLGNMFSKAYQQMLGKEKFSNLYSMVRNHYSKEHGSDKLFEDTKEFLYLQKVFFTTMFETNILKLNIKKAKEEINALPISPTQKNKIMRIIENRKLNLFRMSDVEKLIIEAESIHPDIGKIAEKVFLTISEDVKTNIEKTKKEVFSFSSIVKLGIYYKMMQEAPDKNSRIELLNMCYHTVGDWAKKGLGLFDEQVETALNAIILNEKRESAEFFIFHSMGTGKTRLALFYQLLYSATNPREESIFAVQGKNLYDIAEQVGDMLPSLSTLININSRDGIKNDMSNISIPVSLVENVYPNLFSGKTKNIFISSSAQDIKTELSKKFLTEIKELSQWQKDTPKAEIEKFLLSDIKHDLLTQLYEVDKLFKEIIVSDISRIGSQTKVSDMDKYLDVAKENVVSIIIYVDKYIKTGNIDDSAESVEFVSNKIINTYTDYFQSALIYEKKQKQNKISITSQTLFDYFPNVEFEDTKQETLTEGKKNTVYTNKNIEYISVDEVGYPMILSKFGNLSKAVMSQYEPKNKDSVLWLFYENTNDNNLDSIKVEISRHILNHICEEDFKDTNPLAFSYMQRFAHAISGLILPENIYEGTCPSILSNNAPVSCECAVLGETSIGNPTLYSLIEKVKEIGSLKESAEKMISLLDKQNFCDIVNKSSFNTVFASFLSPQLNYKEKSKKLTLYNVSAPAAEIQFHCTPLPSEEPFYIVGSKRGVGAAKGVELFTCYNGSSISTLQIKNPQKRTTKKIVGDVLKVSYNGKRGTFDAKIEFDSLELKRTSKINFTSSYIFTANSGSPLIITDEGHKNKVSVGDQSGSNNNKNDGEEENVAIKHKKVTLTGTPTNGTASSVSKTIYHTGKEIDAKMPQLSAAAGIQRISNHLYASLFTMPMIQNDFIKLATETYEQNTDEHKVEMLIAKMQSFYEIKIVEMKEIIEVARKAKQPAVEIEGYGNIKLIKNFLRTSDAEIFSAIKRMQAELNKGLTGVDALFSSMPKSYSVEYPGITHPGVFAKEITSDPSKEFSVNPGVGRTYILEDAQNIRSGIIEPLSGAENTYKLNEYKLNIPMVEYALLKSLSQTKLYDSLCAKIDFVVVEILYSTNKKIQEQFYQEVVEELSILVGSRYDAESSLPTLHSLKKELTTKNNGGSDNFVLLFKEKLISFETDEWKNISQIKVATCNVISKLVNSICDDSLYIKNWLSEQCFESSKAMVDSEVLSEMHKMIDSLRDKTRGAEIDIDSHRAYDYASSEMGTPMVGKLEFDLKNHFTNIFKFTNNPAPASLKLIHGQERENIAEFLTDATDQVVQLAMEDKSSLLLTTRTTMFQLKLCELLEELYAKSYSLKKPHYVVANIPSNQNIKAMLSEIDKEFLSKKNIFLIPVTTNHLSYTYENRIPKDANFTILSSLESIAEGFRFPRVNKTIIAGRATNIASTLQAISRVFFPNKVFDSLVSFAGRKTSLAINDDKENMETVNDCRRILISELLTNKSVDVLAADRYSSLIFTANIEGVSTVCSDPETGTKSIMKKIVDGVIASLKFMDADTKGVEQEEKTTFFLDNNLENEIQKISSMIKAKK